MHAVDDRKVGAGARMEVATLLAENARLEAELDGLHRALQSRAAIEQAKGILMGISGCTEAEAFDRLVQLSQRRNVRLRVLAEMLLQVASLGRDTPDKAGLRQWLGDEIGGPNDRGNRPARGREPGRPRR